ncbi:hypothetical protein ERO13_A01G218950v2 [Gossypium hirsutum]|uniref:Membrane-associated kinase regulator 3 n=5 Tax=Gossypium TaxID=3633 RepID=A0A5J5X0Z7_GOSBA|nr:probable membrane-associated kinase regulator 3 [Gossypium hirsutum]KAB2098340.1 hypothetical protein ES319_A01G231700v1 [Gossypium barbadense]TYH32403.1 hypothetical protein ES288_A01G249700v1 [Gossypium darwinii]TYI44718.1 hypothetical protein ES332_A01G257200v1 [Gossypium tomentosum]TYJ50842.1 hypothetical protein E1A91_A01G236700v1 [Gossypium mustelinum]KAG4216078.1 hypothetical protein ERO13_A01G218950v2 [Gossypium hirsutum]
METTQASYNNGDEEDYIDIEVSSSSSNLLFYPITSPPSPQFEFQTCSSFYGEIASTTSPADELFYKGKLLPLHLPPRLQMLQSLLQTEEHCSSMASSSSSGFIGNNLKKSWCRKLKQIKQSTITQKLKSLFNKSGCSYECCCVKASVNTNGSHRRSFSGVIQRYSTPIMSLSTSSSSSGSSSSSSFSFGSSGFGDLHLLKRSNSSNSEVESSIQGAIVHCKMSQKLSSSKENSAK